MALKSQIWTTMFQKKNSLGHHGLILSVICTIGISTFNHAI